MSDQRIGTGDFWIGPPEIEEVHDYQPHEDKRSGMPLIYCRLCGRVKEAVPDKEEES